MTPAAALLIAMVADDAIALRSAPVDTAPAQATLHRGDWLEVRGEVPGFLKVWDHRRERPGYIRPDRVRVHRADDASADELRAIVRFVRDTRGYESLGIGYAALYLRVAAPSRRARPEWAEVLTAMGTMAERLADRGSGTRQSAGAAGDALLVGQLGVVESYGVRLRRFERDARTVVCYDGDAFARVLSLAAATPEEKARAALALTRERCFDPASAPDQRRHWNEARLAVLAEASPARPEHARLARPLAHRLRLRSAEALAESAHAAAAAGDLAAAARHAAEAMRLLALVDVGELAPEHLAAREAAAVRVGAMRWLVEPPAPTGPLTVELAPNGERQTCVRVWPRQRPPSVRSPLVERCTFGVAFAPSVRVAPSGRAVAVAVAPVAGWTELWLFRQDAAGAWHVDVRPPAAGRPGDDLGYVELAGFSPDARTVLVVREFRVEGRAARRFEVLSADGTVLRWASHHDRLAAFARWAAPDWRRSTLALRR